MFNLTRPANLFTLRPLPWYPPPLLSLLPKPAEATEDCGECCGEPLGEGSGEPLGEGRGDPLGDGCGDPLGDALGLRYPIPDGPVKARKHGIMTSTGIWICLAVVFIASH